MKRLSTKQRAAVVAALVEGNSIRATCRMTGVAKNTVVKLLAGLGAVCSKYQHETMRNLPCRRLEVDEIWAFCYAKAKNVPKKYDGQFGYGDVWTFTAIDADTKLVPSWLLGTRDGETATEFMRDLASRLSNRVQITTDGHRMYLNAVGDAFGSEVDYAMLQKHYQDAPDSEKRYSPARVTSVTREEIQGRPNARHISTSYVERQNLTMRMQMRRYTRLTNGFSKKLENLEHAVALHFMHYNFARIHATLRVTPAMEAGITDHLWSIEEIIGLLEAQEPNAVEIGKRRKDRQSD